MRGMTIYGAVATVLMFLMTSTTPAWGAVWYVDKHNAGAVKDGTSWQKAFNTIQEGIDAAANAGGGEVWVRAAVYDEARNGVEPRTGVDCGSLILKDDVSIYGGFSGTETTRSARDWKRFETFIDGSTSRSGQPAYHVVICMNRPLLDGFTVRGGNASVENTERDSGAAVYSYWYNGNYGTSPGPATPVFQNCVFRDNTAIVGAVLSQNESSVTFSDCTFTRNRNGCVRSTNGVLTLTRCIVSENINTAIITDSTSIEATDCAFTGNFGRPITHYSGGFLQNCLFVNNASKYDSGQVAYLSDAGAIWVGHFPGQPELTIDGCTFIGNASDIGGAIATRDSSPTITDCTFINNRATTEAGAIAVRGGNPTIERCQFRNNFGYLRGGAIAVGTLDEPMSTVATIKNSVFVQNVSGQNGGGVYGLAADLSIWNCTFWENDASNGGGVFVILMPSFTMVNSILRGNTANQFSQSSVTVLTTEYNNVEGGLAGTGNFDSAETFVDENAGDFRLTSGSPGVDAGTNTGAPLTDLAGIARPQSGTVDMGAYEYTTSPVQPVIQFGPRVLDVPGGEKPPLSFDTQSKSGTSTGLAQYSPPPIDRVVELRQPDGSMFEARPQGSSLFVWFVTPEGWLVAQDDSDSWYKFLILDSQGNLVLSDERVGHAGKAFFPIERTDPSVQQAIEAHIATLERTGQEKAIEGLDGHLTPSTGTVHSLVVLVNFSDTTTTYTQADIDGLFNTPGYNANGANGSVADYLDETSGGALNVDFTVTNWVTLLEPHDFYGLNQSGYPKEPNVSAMVSQALDALDAGGFDFSTMDANNDGWVDNVIFLHQGGGEEATFNAPDIWSHANSGITPLTYDGKSIDTYCVVPEVHQGLKTVGVITHEMLHTMGLPDLYDRDLSTLGVGDWDIMGYGIWLDNGRTPSHLSAWCKDYLGWVTPTVLSTPQTNIPVPAVESGGTVYKIATNMPSGEYLLVENRQLQGFDSFLAEPGLLVWHIDEKAATNFTSNFNEMRPLVGLMSAGGLPFNDYGGVYGLTINGDFDPFPGSTVNRTLDGSTNPSTDSNLWGDTGIVISNISDSAPTMDFDFSLSPIVNSAARTLFVGNSGTGPLSVTGISKSPNASWLTWDATTPFGVAPGAAPYVISLNSDMSLSTPGVTDITLSITSDSSAKTVSNISLAVRDLKAGKLSITDSLAPTADRALDFGSTPSNTLKSATVTLTNSGPETLTIASIAIEADSGGKYALTSKPANLTTVAPSASAEFRVRYLPAAEAHHTATVVIKTDSAETPFVPIVLRGTGVAPAVDSDGDGVSDADEGTVANSDGDAYLDYLDTDSDNDGVSDGVEVAWGTNRLSAASTPLFYTVFVDFAYTGFEMLTNTHPANTLGEGAAGVASGGIVSINGASSDTASPESVRITKPMRIQPTGGAVRIGSN